MLKIWKILGGLTMIIAFSSCGSDAAGVRGVILPHHNLVSDYIDGFYEEISDMDVDRIILMSTNHFELGYSAIQSMYELDTKVDLDVDFIKDLEKAGFLEVEGISFEAEHGIMVHMDRIEEYFPDVEVVPIVLKWGIPVEHLDRLEEEILDEEGMESTLVIASIDFSHFVTEETAMANDERSMDWLEGWDGEVTLEELLELEKSISMDTEKATAYDSPETLYMFTQLIGDPGSVEVWGRTSSAANFGTTDPLQNTSHLFVKVW